MVLRTWVIRGFILAVLATVAAGVWWAQSYVSPVAVRAALLSTLREQLPDVEVTIRRADIRIFGGISVRELTLTHRGESQPFFHAASATIFHNKEQINRGRLTIRKIVLDEPTLRLDRGPDGRWSFDGLLAAGSGISELPLVVVNRGTLMITDATPGGLPPIVVTNVGLTVVNDPAPVYVTVRGEGLVGIGGVTSAKVSIHATLNRSTGKLTVKCRVPEVLFGPDQAGIVSTYSPRLAEVLGGFQGNLGVSVDLDHTPPQPLSYDLQFTIAKGRFTHPKLPDAVTELTAAGRFRQGQLSVEKVSGKFGSAVLEGRFDTRPLWARPAVPNTPVVPIPSPETGDVRSQLVARPTPPPSDVDPLAEIESSLERAQWTLREVVVDDALFTRLPTEMQVLRTKFQPRGRVALDYRFERPEGRWSRTFEVRPLGMELTYEKFRYPLNNVSGLVRHTAEPAGELLNVELDATAADRPIRVEATVTGSGPDPAVRVQVSGTNVPLDDRVFAALPNPKYTQALRKLRATGRGDFVVHVSQQAGVNVTQNDFRIKLRDGQLSHTQFPYPVTDVTGDLAIHVTTTDASRPQRPGEPWRPLPETDTVELRQFTGRHGPGYVWLKGDEVAVNGGPDRVLRLSVWGTECPIDADLKHAVSELNVGSVWDAFRPEGRLKFTVDVDIIDRASRPATVPAVGPVVKPPPSTPSQELLSRVQPPLEPPFDPANDLKLSFRFEGPTVTPTFFPYRLDRLGGRVTYQNGRVRFEHAAAHHGPSKLSLAAGEVRFCDDGCIFANLGQLNVAPLVVDDPLLSALPAGLRSGVKELNLRGPAELTLSHLVVLAPPDPTGKPGDWPTPHVPVLARAQAGPGPTSTAATPTDPDPDVYWLGELRLAGASFDAGVPYSDVFGKLGCSGRAHPTHLGRVVGNIWFDAAVIASHPLQRVKATFDADPQEFDPRTGRYQPPAFRVTDMTGALFQGTLGGTARVVLSDPVRYRLALTATGIRLEDLARHHNLGDGAKLEGAAQANLLLETAPDPVSGHMVLTGSGNADVDQGHLLKLPVVLPLLKTLRLQAPDKTFFEEAHAAFTIRGDRIRVDHLDLLGSAVSLGGTGELDISGRYVKFDFHTIWSRTLQRWLTTPFGDLTAAVSEKLLTIEVTRKPNGELKYDPKVVPAVTEPMRALTERMKQRAGRR